MKFDVELFLSPEKSKLEKDQYSPTTLNSCKRTLYFYPSSWWCSSRKFGTVSMNFNALEYYSSIALTPSITCKDAVRKGSIKSNHPKLVWSSWTIPKLCERSLYTLLSLWICSSRRFDEVWCAWTSSNYFYPLKRISWRRFSTVQPPRTPVKILFISTHLCDDVVRESSMRFTVLEHPRNSA